MVGGERPGAPERVAALLREAHLLRMRRHLADAEAKCREALALAPEDAAALEMLGDLLVEKGALKEAAASYNQAIERAPGRAALEEKHARLALSLGEQQHQRAMAEMLLQNPGLASSGRRPKPWLAFFLSSVWPGFGQLYNEEYVKGMVMAGGALLAFLLGGESLTGLVSGGRAGSTSAGSFFGLIFVVIWIVALIDAPIRAQKRARGPKPGLY
jgi:tetratricopeptide (TPR) repeat protein